ncbi:hypothetical protein D9758_011827 [Tetrapyrgos nigripes]|uniref:Uncharacterized protein n=1 Tax=Tetrapyrgos nigripes TaxID=182062 RepID=A0A8H5FN93_9AGAR|nr:hypothetical protein D9758_011827 [Tetrapyrgos nigripes]
MSFLIPFPLPALLVEKSAVWCGLLVVGFATACVALRPGHMRKKRFWRTELAYLDTPNDSPLLGTVVISGGSISGILAARMCSQRFEKVILVDPEFRKVDQGPSKSRIMQYHSCHGFPNAFTEGICELWPGFLEKLKQRGGMADFKVHYNGVYVPAPDSLPITVNIRRSKLDPLLQSLLLEHYSDSDPSKLIIMDGTVQMIMQSPENQSIESVTVRMLDGSAVQLDNIDLFIDCTGNTQTGKKWLRLGPWLRYPMPQCLSYDPNMTYVTVTFSVSEELEEKLPVPGGYNSTTWFYTFRPHHEWCNAGFLLTKMDNNTVQFCCGSWGPYELPRAPDQLESFVRSVKGRDPVPDWVPTMVGILASQGKPEFERVRIPKCKYVQYHLMKKLPQNFVAMGDSVLQLNPLYGQGSLMAMLGVVTLNTMLLECKNRKLTPSFSREYFKTLAGRQAGLWTATKAVDYGFKTTTPVAGEKLSNGKIIRWFTDKLEAASETDRHIVSLVWQVRQQLLPENTLAQPAFLVRLFWVLFLQKMKED